MRNVLAVFVILFGLLVSCDDKTSNEKKNNAPQISSLTANPSNVKTGESTTLTCTANDGDGDNLTYVWSAVAGGVNGSGASVSWISPSTEGTYSVSCKVIDGNGGEVAEIVNVTVEKISSGDQIVSYTQNFSTNPNFTSLSSQHAYWDSQNGNYFVNAKDDLNAKYWGYSPSFDTMGATGKETSIEFDLLFEKQDWGTYPGILFYQTEPLERNAEGNKPVLRIENAYRNSYGSKFTLPTGKAIHFILHKFQTKCGTILKSLQTVVEKLILLSQTIQILRRFILKQTRVLF